MAQARTTKLGGPRGTASIGRTTRVHGRVSGEGDLVVEGRVEGDVRLRGDLTVAEGGAVIADVIEAHAVRLDGNVEAQVEATGPVHLGGGARVRGDLKGSAIAIDDGADFAGRIDCEFELPPELGGSPGKRGR